MEQKACEESLKNASDFKCEKVLETVDESIACPTPQKNAEPLTVKSREGQINLPEKYSTLAELFGHMSCSLRLLHLFKKTPNFQNVCRQVEVLSKREFSHSHLAQMMYILPESICIDKVLVHDKKSLCMVPDMKITLRFEVVKDCSGESAYLALLRYFKSKLIDFFDMHPEVPDIPEAPLPKPFGKKTSRLNCEDSHVEEFTGQSLHVSSSTDFLSISNQTEMLPEQLQLYPSFRRHFSRENNSDLADKAQCFSPTKTSPSSNAYTCPDNEESEKVPKTECVPTSDDVTDPIMERGHQKESFSLSFQPSVINTPVHMIHPPHSVTCSNSESPDTKNISCAADTFITETPAQSAPARLLPISDVKLQVMSTQKSTSSQKPAKRVLDFSLMEDHGLDKLESSRALHEFDSVSVPQEAEESLGLDRWHEKSSPLLDLVNVIHSIFQSVQRNPITKEELLHKILMNSLDFVEIREVEQQIESLEKLVPDWICKKLVLTGDTLYCINKVSDLDSVRSRLSSNQTV